MTCNNRTPEPLANHSHRLPVLIGTFQYDTTGTIIPVAGVTPRFYSSVAPHSRGPISRMYF